MWMALDLMESKFFEEHSHPLSEDLAVTDVPRRMLPHFSCQ